MDDLVKHVKAKRIWSIVLLILSIIGSVILGFFSISFLSDSLDAENELFKLAMILIFVIGIPVFIISLLCNIVSLVLQFTLKKHKYIVQLIITFIALVAIIGFSALYMIVLMN